MGHLLRFLYPEFCVSCGIGKTTLCEECKSRLNESIQICWSCKKGALRGLTHAKCLDSSSKVSQFITCYYYNNTTRKIIQTIKYNFSSKLCSLISDLIYERIKIYNLVPNSYITYTPQHKSKDLVRGFNHTKIISEAIANRYNLEFIDLLKKTYNTKPQALTSKSLRNKNIHGAFQVLPNIKLNESKSIIIFDDVVTTGSTMKEMIKTINSNYNNKIIVMCFAYAGYS